VFSAMGVMMVCPRYFHKCCNRLNAPPRIYIGREFWPYRWDSKSETGPLISRAVEFEFTLSQVSSDEEAIRLMNDSPYGLTASIWTNVATNPKSQEVFLKLVDELETGTVFLNR
jgi:Aldehyde dehydrogenase family